MDWSARYNAQLNCKTKMMKLCIPGEATLKLDVRGRLVSSALISGIRVRKILNKGAQRYLAFLINTPSDKVRLEDMPVIKEHPDVFSKELESLPPEREIFFKIDVTPGVALISKTPYRMAPTELKGLKLQLQDLLERDFIKESLARYYQRFIKGFSKIAGPLTELTKKSGKFIWSLKCEENFQELKRWLTRAPVLALPNGKDSFVVYTDASKEGLGCVLMQDECIKEAQEKDIEVQKWLEKVSKGEKSDFNLRVNGVLRSRNRIVVPNDEGLKKKILEETYRSKYKFWQNMQEVLGTKLNFSTTYHPQTDGQSEKTIQTLENMLRTCTLDFGKSWRNVAYKLELPPCLSRIHSVFHVSMLKKYHPDPSHVLQPENLEIDEALTYEEKPIKFLDRKVKELRNKRIPLVKVL
ncbi:uncharacterized protein LOC113766426 [Coffea eugenioides]|uniref:uncharacterized protein LOC113766426 n=1 Tax=Coffea eugenioides TaxID=49369 RepID=UPI000F60518E|nr:uncharacterized protein LOC113766426 [Coffea eugenioides]